MFLDFGRRFTRRQIEQAQKARNFFHDLNAENVENMKFFFQSNQSKNVEVSTGDICVWVRFT